jgi:hypothetical protein
MPTNRLRQLTDSLNRELEAQGTCFNRVCVRG